MVARRVLFVEFRRSRTTKRAEKRISKRPIVYIILSQHRGRRFHMRGFLDLWLRVSLNGDTLRSKVCNHVLQIQRGFIRGIGELEFR